MDRTVVLIVIGVMLVGGTIAAVLWWHLADTFFPGASRKTGQRILGRGDTPKGPPPTATVVKDFDKPD